MCVGGVVSDLGITQSNRVSAHAVTSVQPINFFTHPPQRSKGVAKSVKKLFFGMKSPGGFDAVLCEEGEKWCRTC